MVIENSQVGREKNPLANLMEAFHDHDQGNQDKNIELGKIDAQGGYEP
jgi:hypothetical protein